MAREKTHKEVVVGMHPHHGAVIKAMYLDRLGVSIGEVAKSVGVSRKNFSQLINGHFSLTADMAVKLARVFKTSPQMLLMLQMEYAIEQAEKRLSQVIVESLV